MSDYFEMMEKVKHQNRRDFFAAFAMFGHFIVNDDLFPATGRCQKYARGSVAMADLLITELDKVQKIEKKDSCL